MKTHKKYKPKEEATNMVSEPMGTYGSQPAFYHFATGDEYSLVKKAREGLKTEVFYSLADEINMPEKSLAAVLNLSPRTISNYRDQQKSLDPTYSEHLLKLINLYQLGEEIFGSIEEFNLWMDRPFWNSDERPIAFITTPAGVDLVHREVEKLAQGYPV